MIHSLLVPLQIRIGDIFNQPSPIPGVEVATTWLPYIGVAVLLIIGFLGIRVWKNMTAFPNDEERIGKVSFVWMGHYKFTGNVSRWTEPLDETTLEFLANDPKYSEAISRIVDLVKQKKLFVYLMKIMEWDDAFDVKGRKEPWVVISSADIAHPDYSWEDTRGEFNWGTMRKEKPRYVICYEDSKYFDVLNVEGNIVDVMIISPIPRVTVGENGTAKIGIDDEEIGMTSHILKVEKLQEMKALANIIPYLIPLAETTDLIKSKNVQVREYRKLVEDRDAIINKLQRDGDETRILAAEKPIIGEEPQAPPEPPGHPWIWFALFGFAAIIGYKVPPSIAALERLNPDLAAILAIVVVGAIYALTHRRKESTGMTET